jgi:hypothetical protein
METPEVRRVQNRASSPSSGRHLGNNVEPLLAPNLAPHHHMCKKSPVCLHHARGR